MKANPFLPIALGLLALALPSPALAADPPDAFYDDFGLGAIDPDRWYAVRANFDSWHAYYSGGVVPENLYVRDGILHCEAHGDRYAGDVFGADESGRPRKDRVGACASTRGFFASGRYEVRARVAPVLGVCSAMWTLSCGTNKNQEVAFQLPGRPAAANEDIGFGYALCSAAVGEKNHEYQRKYAPLPQAQDDGAFHVYRFDWHTGDAAGTIAPRVEFYVDGVLVATNDDHVPTRAARFRIGAWFPKGWAGTPDFDTRLLEIDWVRITPFHEENDKDPEDGADQSAGLVEPLDAVPPPLWAVGSPVAWDVTARLDGNGVLAFRGSGAITNFAAAADAPWAADAGAVAALVIDDGIDAIGPRSLAGLYNVATINGTPLARFSEALAAAGMPDPAAGAAAATNLAVRVLWSTNLVDWAPVEAGVAPGTDGRSVRAPVPAGATRGFFRFETR